VRPDRTLASVVVYNPTVDVTPANLAAQFQ
jgi:hypothetical protein